MKTKLLLCPALVLAGCLIPMVVQAFWAVVPVHPDGINSTAPFVRVLATSFGTNDSRIAFSVFVLPKEKQDEKYYSGVLTVKDDAGGFIVHTEVQPKPEAVAEAVPKSWAGKCLVFRFEVAAGHLAQSEFDLNVTGDLKWGTGGESFQFNLKEFATAK